MTLENFRADNYRTDVESLLVTAAATLTNLQRVVRCTPAASFSLTLPSVAAAKGLKFFIAVTTAGGFTVTVQDQDDSEAWSDVALTADNDALCVESDGRKWWIMHEVST